MKNEGLIEIDVVDIDEIGGFIIPVARLLREFQHMKAEAVKVNISYANRKEFRNVSNTFRYIIKSERIPVEVLQRKDELLLIKL